MHAGTFDWMSRKNRISCDKFPDTDPLSVRFTDLHKWVTELAGFSGDPKLSNEGKLEAIQMAWLEDIMIGKLKDLASPDSSAAADSG